MNFVSGSDWDNTLRKNFEYIDKTTRWADMIRLLANTKSISKSGPSRNDSANFWLIKLFGSRVLNLILLSILHNKNQTHTNIETSRIFWMILKWNYFSNECDWIGQNAFNRNKKQKWNDISVHLNVTMTKWKICFIFLNNQQISFSTELIWLFIKNDRSI